MKWPAPVLTAFAGALLAAFAPSTLHAQNITQVTVRVKTSSNSSSLGISGAQTDGTVYLGLGGREFNLDQQLNDFEAGSDVTYLLGDSPNVLNASGNDPRSSALTFTNALAFPVYIRLSELADDDWNVDYVEVQIFSNGIRAQFSWSALGSLNDARRMRFGRLSGSQLYLTRTD
jgi:hypothetical protein